ncbi:MAG TPA: LPS assembly protein LptD [Pyrinomonadaceae bacterium]|nr:LPS assembly protein LptD [Pyrinomonadaceae bacterium]
MENDRESAIRDPLVRHCARMLASARLLSENARLLRPILASQEARLTITGAEVRKLRVRAVTNMFRATRTVFILLSILFGFSAARAQQTNPVDRKVENPVTDTPNVNPLQQDQPIRPAPTTQQAGAQATDVLTVSCNKEIVSGPKEARVSVCEGNVDARIGTYRLQADKVTVYDATNKVVAEGNVVFDQGDQQRITGSHAEWNYRTKTGFFENSTGYTNQTQDGTRMYFTADRVEKISLNTIVVINGEITACDEEVPKWSFRTKKATIKTGDRVRIRSASFRIKHVPILYTPYVSISLKHRDRASGFLTPTFSSSGEKGFRLSEAYYLTLGRSADFTLRGDLYSKRGYGIGGDLRTRANSRSFFNLGFFIVKDRVLGHKADALHPDQGGSSFYIDAVHYFPNGFLAAADVNITSNLAFRQVFSDSIQQAISPEERSQIFINKSYKAYSLNFRMNSQATTLQNSQIRIRELPSVTFDRRPAIVRWLKKLPVYLSWEAGVEGVSRKEKPADLAIFRTEAGRDPILTPSIVQRFDFHPMVSLPLDFAGWSLTLTGGLRVTYYSNSIDAVTKLVSSRDIVRGYGEFELDLRPPALARNFRRGDGSVRFRHVIEPYIIYRRIAGIDNFNRIIRFDYVDAIADTNEIEYGLTNRFFTRRSTESVGPKAARLAREKKDSLATQPYEALTITIRGKYFFDPYFGGALIPGQRNQFYPIDTFSAFSYGAVPRRFSPLNVDVRYRPTQNTFADFRSDLDTRGGGLRAMAATVGINRANLIEAFSTFYYTRAVELVPSLRQYANPLGQEPGTLRGSQWSPAVFLGNREKGLFGGLSMFFDFQKHPFAGNRSLISSTATLGYTWKCCAITVQNYTFNVGLRNENRMVFAFRLNGIGTFGTEKIGQGFR